jgi:nitroreductase
MTILEAIEKRHSVRRFLGKPIESEKAATLQDEINTCYAESGMRIHLLLNDTRVFNGIVSKLMFKNACNFIVLSGKDTPELSEKAGYYGERIVIKAQQLGLNTCWIGMFSGKKYSGELKDGERVAIIICIGYGETEGKPHKGKAMDELCITSGEMPDWFKRGMEAVMLAPSAANRQPVVFTLDETQVKAKASGGSFSKVDLGIAKYHFEMGAGKENFEWEKDV